MYRRTALLLIPVILLTAFSGCLPDIGTGGTESEATETEIRTDETIAPGNPENEELYRIYLSPAGSDANDGMTQLTALLTPEAAKNMARAYTGPGNVEIVLAPGEYRLQNGLVFDSMDTPGTDRTVRWYAEPDMEAVLTSLFQPGEALPASEGPLYDRLPSGVRDRVLYYPLESITADNFIPQVLVYYDQTMCLPSRYPLTGTAPLSAGGTRKSRATGPNESIDYSPTYAQYQDDRIGSWGSAQDLYALGSWTAADSMSLRPVLDLNASAKILTFTTAADESPDVITDSSRCVFYNIPEELTTPGEYVTDTVNKGLYFLPPNGFDPSRLYVSTTGVPLISFAGAENIQFKNLTLKGGCSNGIGVQYSRNLLFDNIQIRLFHGSGISVTGGFGVSVRNSDISFCGGSAIVLSGGMISNSSPGGHTAEGNTIHNISLVNPALAAVRISGSSNKITGCKIHEAPSSAIEYAGSYLFIANNQIDHCSDLSACRGVIRAVGYWNPATSIRGNSIQNSGTENTAGILLTGYSSLHTVTDNNLTGLDVGISVMGGSGNQITANHLNGCLVGMVLEASGLSILKDDQNAIAALNAYNPAAAPNKQLLPGLAGYGILLPERPSGNVAENNSFTGCDLTFDFRLGAAGSDLEMRNNVIR